MRFSNSAEFAQDLASEIPKSGAVVRANNLEME
jgi:hypothetical protein